MLDSIYVGLTGLTGFSKGLNAISNNVANMNTVGYKSGSIQFGDLFYQQQWDSLGAQYDQQKGAGLATGKSTFSFKAGTTQQTGNDLDLTISGYGLFVLKKDNQLSYTRDGQFQIDNQGYLVSQAQGARVMGLVNGSLQEINTSGFRTSPPQPTKLVKFLDNLSSDGVQHVIDPVIVYDALGKSHNLKIQFDNNSATTPGNWKITVLDGTTSVATGNIQFITSAVTGGSVGSIDPNFSTFSFNYQPANTPSTSIQLDFSTGVTSFAGGTTSTLKFSSQDGYAAGALTKLTVDGDGNLVATYSNGQTAKPSRIALAWFVSPESLNALGNNSYIPSAGQVPVYGVPNDAQFGKIVSGSVELSNVDLTREFGELIVTQRGYQASSQVLSASNEMIQQLLDLKGKR